MAMMIDEERVPGEPRPRGLMTIEELSRRLAVAKGTLYNWVSAGRVPHTKLGRCLRFDPVEIENWLLRAKLGEAGKR